MRILDKWEKVWYLLTIILMVIAVTDKLSPKQTALALEFAELSRDPQLELNPAALRALAKDAEDEFEFVEGLVRPRSAEGIREWLVRSRGQYSWAFTRAEGAAAPITREAWRRMTPTQKLDLSNVGGRK